MGKSRTKVCAPLNNYICAKRSTHNKKQTLKQKYKNILGSKQPIVLLRRCIFLKNIFHKSSVQNLPKNCIDNKHDTSKLICSTNHVPYQSPHVEETICNDLIHNSKVASPKSSIKDSRKIKTCDLIHSSNDDCAEPSKKVRKKVTVTNKNCTLSVVPSDTKESNNVSKTLNSCSHSNTLLKSKRSVPQSVQNKIKEGQMQDNDLIGMETARIPHTQNRNRGKQKSVSVYSASTKNNKDKEYSDTMPMQEAFLTLNNNFLTEHTADSTVKHAAVDNYESKKSKDEGSSLLNRNTTRTTAAVPSLEYLNTSTLQKRLLRFSNKNLKMHTVEDNQKDSVVNDRAPLDTNITESSECLDTVISEERCSSSCSNSLSEQNTEEHTIPDTNNTQCDALDHQYGNLGMKQKRLYGKNNDGGSMKKVKLNRSTWCKILKTEEETNDTSKTVETSNRDVELNNNKEVPELTLTDASRICADVLEQDNKTFDVTIAEASLTEDQGASSTEKQNWTETFGYSAGIECEARIDAEQSPNLEIKTISPVIQDISSVKENANFNRNNSYSNEDDCISLYAESMLIEECDDQEPLRSQKSKESSLVSDKYFMSDDAVDNYYKNNALEFNEVYNLYASNSKTDIPREKDLFRTPKMRMGQKSWNTFLGLFRGYCYKMLIQGKCVKQDCRFKHDFLKLMKSWYNRNEKIYFRMIDELVLKGCNKFLQHFCGMCVAPGVDVTQLLKTLKRLYDKNITTDAMVYDFIKKLTMLDISLKLIVDHLIAIVDSSDVDFVSYMSQIMFNFIIPGEIWMTLRPLLIRMDNLKEYVIEIVMAESLLIRKHIRDIYENVLHKLDADSLAKIKPHLLSKFNEVFAQSCVTQVEQTVTTNAALTRNISSPDHTYEPEVVSSPKKSHIYTTLVWHDVLFANNNNSQGESSSVVLHPIDDVSEPYSRHSREKFWKFYLDIHSLKEGLKHGDYEHVKRILDAAQTKDVTPFTRACYNILIKKIQHSQYHLCRLASLAVQTGATATFCKIFIDVTINILAALAEKELWILALQLLKSIEIILHQNNYSFNLDAIAVMLFCEIYLVNRKPMKAYTLLKQSNIIYPCRTMWKVNSNERDDHIRTQLVTILLKMFCDTSPENAFGLFRFLLLNQTSNFHPIDLSSQANKVLVSLLLKNDHDLIISFAKLIDNYNCTLRLRKHRALISSMVHINLKYAQYMYRVAINLGVYSNMQFYPIMALIVKSNWTREEMYLAALNIIEQLARNVDISSKRISVYLAFEAISSGTDEQCKKELQASITLMRTVLQEQFDPPLSMIAKSKGRFYKLSSISVSRQLQSFTERD